MSLDKLIELLGGDQAVARLCKIGPSAVSNWRQRGLPSSRGLQLLAAASRRGIPLAVGDLPRMRRARRPQ
jgi:hypothetical protein